MAAILFHRLFDNEPITVRKLERIALDLGMRSGRSSEYTLKSLFDRLFEFPEFTLQDLIRLIDAKILDDDWMDGFLISAIKNLRDVTMIEYLKNLPIRHRHSPAQIIGNNFSEARFKLYQRFFPIPEDIICRISTTTSLEIYEHQIRFLRAQGFEINLLGEGETILTRLLTYYRHLEIKDRILILISLGADVNFPNSKGNTPLHLAYSWKLFDCAEVLLAHGANPEQPNNFGTKPSDVRSYMENLIRLSNRLKEIEKEVAILRQEEASLQTPQL